MASTAVVVGSTHVGAGAVLTQGLVIRSHGDASVSIGNHSAMLENGVVVGTRDWPVRIGRPPHVLRSASDADRQRVAALREYQTDPTDHPGTIVHHRSAAGADMGQLYAYRDKTPQVSGSAVLFDSAEITGDVHIGPDTIIGAGVKIIGDSHGPVRIGARVQILENTVLHLLPDNELIIEEDVVIGPAAMIHGCHIGAGTLIEPAAIVCDSSRVGRGSLVRAGACVKQRDVHPDLSVLDGFPARQVDTLRQPPSRPGWALHPDDLPSIARLTR